MKGVRWMHRGLFHSIYQAVVSQFRTSFERMAGSISLYSDSSMVFTNQLQLDECNSSTTGLSEA